MTADQRFTLIMTAIGVLFSIMCFTLGLIWKTGQKWGSFTAEIADVVKDVAEQTRYLDRHMQWHIDSTSRRR